MANIELKFEYDKEGKMDDLAIKMAQLYIDDMPCQYVLEKYVLDGTYRDPSRIDFKYILKDALLDEVVASFLLNVAC